MRREHRNEISLFIHKHFRKLIVLCNKTDRIRIQHKNPRASPRGNSLHKSPEHRPRCGSGSKAGTCGKTVRPVSIHLYIPGNGCRIVVRITGNHCLRQTCLQNLPVGLRRYNANHTGTGVQCSRCRKNGCSGHSAASRQEENLSERPLVSVRGTRRKPGQVLFFHRKNKIVPFFFSGKFRRRDNADTLNNSLSAVRGSGVQNLSALTILKCNSQVCTDRILIRPAGVCIYTGRHINRQNEGPLTGELPDGRNCLGCRSFDFPVKTDADKSIDDNRPGRVFRHLFLFRRKRKNGDVQCLKDGKLLCSRGRNLSSFGKQIDLYAAAVFCEQSSECEAVRPVVSSAAVNEYAKGAGRIQFHYFLPYRKRCSFHENKLRNADLVLCIAVCLRILRCSQKIFHLLLLSLLFASAYKFRSQSSDFFPFFAVSEV